MRKILIVDDEKDLCDILHFNLQAQGFDVYETYSAESAWQILQEKRFDLLLLDVMMEGMSGFDLAKKINGSVPIIFLTAKDTEEDMLEGFSLGADDYISKPFSVREVMARIKAVINRTCTEEPTTLSFNGLVINLNNKTITVDHEEISLTKTEFEILKLLVSEQGNVFSRQQLIERIWPKDVIVTNRTVDVNITRLRKKIGRYASNIITRQGFGYCFEA
jgi:DNA-binding response OmpR family regulator